MRITFKILVSLSFLWTTALGFGATAEGPDFSIFAGKLTQSEYQARFEKYAAANGKNCDPAARPKTLSYLNRHFVESATGLTVLGMGEEVLASIPWREEGSEAVQEAAPLPYTIILDPGLERQQIVFTEEGKEVGKFDYAATMKEAVGLLREKLQDNPHPKMLKVVSTHDTIPTPTTVGESKKEAAHLVEKAKAEGSTPFVISIHMNVNPKPSDVRGQVEVSSVFPYIVSFVPGGHMEGELGNEATRFHMFLPPLV